MTGASIEKTEQLWQASLEEAQGLLRPLFAQERVALSAGLFLEGLLGPERRKTGWMRAGKLSPEQQRCVQIPSCQICSGDNAGVKAIPFSGLRFPAERRPGWRDKDDDLHAPQ